MKFDPAFFARLLLCALLGVSGAHAAEKRLYRYTNLEGNVVIDDRVPSEFVGNGYEVINSKGVVLDVVPRNMTAEERAAREQRSRAEVEAAEARKRSLERDENLLLRYSTIEDIEAAKERALSQLRIRISILKSNRGSLKQKMEVMQAQAADVERQGRKVDDKQLEAMADMREELLNTEQSIELRHAELEKVTAAFDDDIARFKELLTLVELRRRKERGDIQ
nr:hypothetical protein [Parahaliea mediterranea]